MKKEKPSDMYRRLGHGIVAALTCQSRIFVTLVVYTMIALALLTYVSAQVYTTVLTQAITELKRERHQHQEAFNKLTSQYISMSSRTRVTHYCESVLGMIQGGSFERFAVEGEGENRFEPVEFTHGFPQSKDQVRFTLLRETGQSDR